MLFAQIPLHPVLNRFPTREHWASDSPYITNEQKVKLQRVLYSVCVAGAVLHNITRALAMHCGWWWFRKLEHT